MRIGLAGTMSTGKSTLVKKLSKIDKLKKYKFFVERSKYLSGLGVPLNQESNFKGQLIFLAERAAELLEENIITDRTSVCVTAFSKTSSLINIRQQNYLTEIGMELSRSYDIIFYVPPILPMEDNGVRETDLDYRDKIDMGIIKLLKHPTVAGKIEYLKSENLEDRIEEVLKVIDSR